MVVDIIIYLDDHTALDKVVKGNSTLTPTVKLSDQ